VLDLSLFQLMRAFQSVMTQFEGAEVREVELESFTIEEKIDAVQAALGEHEPVLFADLFADAGSRIEVIVTFMALLELLKHGQARVQQDASFGSIYIYKGEHFGRPMDEVSDWSADPAAPVEVDAPLEDTAQDATMEHSDGESAER
jgi:chromatin segregation and condensation protein Rec8/ScpA/Scc1 (kleisin family)